jgi:hypothetical protein
MFIDYLSGVRYMKLMAGGDLPHAALNGDKTMTFSINSEARRNLIGFLAALPLAGLLIGAMYSAVGIIG